MIFAKRINFKHEVSSLKLCMWDQSVMQASRLRDLPDIMLAPNGARRSRRDHPALPITIAETVAAAQSAHAVGAQALHAHVRDDAGQHVLDAGLYRELIAEMLRQVPGMPVQITTESVGRYSPESMRRVVEAVRPEGVSVALSEMWPVDAPDPDARRFYQWAGEAGIVVQHILYTPDDVMRLARLTVAEDIPGPLQCLFVLGRYDPALPATPAMLDPFLAAARAMPNPVDWAVCAFGPAETECLLTAIQRGGKARIGFENNILGPDGVPAPDNAARVRDLCLRRGQLSGSR